MIAEVCNARLCQRWLLVVQLVETFRCAISGLDIYLPKSKKDPVSQTASLDRIDSKKPYIEGNVQWVHKIINVMKQSLSDEEFIQYCRTVAKYQDNKNVKMVD